MDLTKPPTIADVRAAAGRLAGRIRRTPVLRSRALDEFCSLKLHLKCENLQLGGAFKIRGATNAVALAQNASAVVTHSSGNHAQALARAAQARGLPCHIVMPRGASAMKRQAAESFGAVLHECEPTYEDRQATAAALVHELGAELIPPFDDPRIIAGQGTVALELLEQSLGLDAILCPVGGGGLISGMTLVARAHGRRIAVFGAEPSGADDAKRSKDSGVFQPQNDPQTIADGLRTSLGEFTWPFVRDQVDAIFTVDDDAIREAMRLLFEKAKVVVEPSGAVGLAVCLSGQLPLEPGSRVGVVLSGGNVAAEEFSALVTGRTGAQKPAGLGQS